MGYNVDMMPIKYNVEFEEMTAFAEHIIGEQVKDIPIIGLRDRLETYTQYFDFRFDFRSLPSRTVKAEGLLFKIDPFKIVGVSNADCDDSRHYETEAFLTKLATFRNEPIQAEFKGEDGRRWMTFVSENSLIEDVECKVEYVNPFTGEKVAGQ